MVSCIRVSLPSCVALGRLGLALLGLLAVCTRAFGVPNLPPGFSTQLIASGLSTPVAFDFAPGDRIFVATKDGRVIVIDDGIVQPRLFVDYRARVNTARDRGMLGIAIHPDFPSVPYVYLLFTYDPAQLAGQTGLAAPDGLGNRVARLIRLEADPAQDHNTALGSDANGIITDEQFVTVLLGTNSTFASIGDPAGDLSTLTPSCDNQGVPINDCLPADEITHTIGTVRFATDGSLFVSNGDGAGASGGVSPYALRAQDVASLAGKLLRIHPLTGEGYAANPFFDGDFALNRAKVWNLGLRNPFRFTVNQDDGEIYIGDVGWGRWEEVNVAGVNEVGGRNFGWPCFEGGDTGSVTQPAYSFTTGCQDLVATGLTERVTAPLFAYNHIGDSASIQLGDFYRGETWPSAYHGGLFYSDINRQVIRYLTLSASGSLIADNAFATNSGGIAQLSAGPDTNLYYVDVYNGEMRRVIYTAGGNTPPTADFTASVTSGTAPLSVTFDAAPSFDPDTDPLTFTWSFDDGATANGPEVSHVFTSFGDFNVVLTATDPSGAASIKQGLISVGNNAPQAVIESVANGNGGTGWQIGDVIVFSGRGDDVEDGTLQGPQLSWNMRVHHNNHIHLDYYTGTGINGQVELLDHDDNSFLELCLTATDIGGLSDTVCEDVRPRESTVNVDSLPSGLTLTYGSFTGTTPFEVISPVGSVRTLAAAPTQNALGFSAWSDGGAAVHDITVPAANTQFTAIYTVEAAASKACGDPNVDPTIEKGMFIWKDCSADDRWHLRTTAGGESTVAVYEGELSSDMALADVSGFSLEATDTLDLPNDQSVGFLQRMIGVGVDGIDFAAAPDSEVCLEVSQLPANADVFVGADRQTIASGGRVNLDTLTTCTIVNALNRAPVIAFPGNQTSIEGAAVTLPIDAVDADNDPLGFVASGLPPGMSIDTDTGVIAGITTTPGSYSVVVSATDGRDGIDTVTFVWTVNAVSTGGNACGDPILDPGRDRGLFVWQDCDGSERWHMRTVTGGSATVLTFAGTFQSTAPLVAVDGFSLESSDVLDTGTAQQIDYVQRLLGVGIDGVDITVTDGASLCLRTTEIPNATSVFLGSSRVAVDTSTNLDLLTQAPCGGVSAAPYCGDPAVNSAVDAGVYIWKDCGVTDAWRLHAVAGGSSSVHVFEGSIAAGVPFTSAAGTSLESTDVVTIESQRIEFILRMLGAGADEIRFSVPEDAPLCSTLTVDMPGSGVFVGAGRLPQGDVFDLLTLGPCQ